MFCFVLVGLNDRLKDNGVTNWGNVLTETNRLWENIKPLGNGAIKGFNCSSTLQGISWGKLTISNGFFRLGCDMKQ